MRMARDPSNIEGVKFFAFVDICRSLWPLHYWRIIYRRGSQWSRIFKNIDFSTNIMNNWAFSYVLGLTHPKFLNVYFTFLEPYLYIFCVESSCFLDRFLKKQLQWYKVFKHLNLSSIILNPYNHLYIQKHQLFQTSLIFKHFITYNTSSVPDIFTNINII